MTKIDKLYDRIMQYPYRKDITFREVRTFLIAHGFIIKQAKGDHVKFEHPQLDGKLIIDSTASYMKPYIISNVQAAISDLGMEDM